MAAGGCRIAPVAGRSRRPASGHAAHDAQPSGPDCRPHAAGDGSAQTAAAAARSVGRRQRIDGTLRRDVPPLPSRRAGPPRPRRDIRVRHPAEPDYPRATPEAPPHCVAASRRGGVRLVGRNPHRRCRARVQPVVEPPGVPGRGHRPDHLGWLGHRLAGVARPGDGSLRSHDASRDLAESIGRARQLRS